MTQSRSGLPAPLLVLVGGLIAATAALIVLAGRPEHDVVPTEEPPLLVLLVAVTLAALHLAAPHVRQLFAGHETLVRSLGGGMASAYVFLMLFPELERGHEIFGDAIHLVVLAGLLAFLALEIPARHRGPNGEKPSHAQLFRLHVGIMWVYNWLVVFALPGIVGLVGAKALITTFAIGLHLLYKDYVVGSDHAKEFTAWGRIVLASAPMVGWVSAMLLEPSEAIGDILIALLAGYLLQNVFRNELPAYQEAKFRWFAAGVLIYSIPVSIYRLVL